MKKVDFPKQFSFSNLEKLVSCDQCGTFFRIPLSVTVKDYSERYYNQMHVNGRFRDVAEFHILQHQVANYNRLLELFRDRIDRHKYKRWLDVGSAGYPTTFSEYDFDTLEPDYRIVAIGRELFKTNRIFCSNIENYKSSKRYDGVLFQNSFYCIPTPSWALKRAWSFLQDKGLLIIAIGSYLMGTKANTADGKYLRIEDVFRGESHWMYYNRFSLEYLCRKHGFVPVDSVEIDSDYSKRTIKYIIFKKEKRAVDQTLLDKSFDFNKKNFQFLFELYYQRSIETLQSFNKENSIFIGTDIIFSDLLKLNKLDKILGFTNYPNDRIADCCSNGIRFFSNELLKKLSGNGMAYDVVIASYKYQQEILDLIQPFCDLPHINILVPERESGIEQLFLPFGEDEVLSKAFTLKPANREPGISS